MLCLCLLFAAIPLFAQNQTVSGVVTEKATGYPAIGVSILVKGTSNGTITSLDGDYTLTDVPQNATLVFSYVGMCKRPPSIERNRATERRRALCLSIKKYKNPARRKILAYEISIP